MKSKTRFPFHSFRLLFAGTLLALPGAAIGQGQSPPNNSWYDGGNIDSTSRSGSWTAGYADGFGNTA